MKKRRDTWRAAGALNSFLLGRRAGTPGAAPPRLLLLLMVLLGLLVLASSSPRTGTAQEEEDNIHYNQDDDDLAYYRYNYASTAYGSSSHSSGLYPPGAMVNGDRKGVGWGEGKGGWNDGTANQFPDYVEVHFEGERVIDRVDIFSLQDNYTNPAEPTRGMVFTRYGLVDFNLSYFDGATGQWVLLAAVRNNNLVWRQIFFEPIRTQKLSIAILDCLSPAGTPRWSRIVEVEAWGRLGEQPPPPPPPVPTPTPTPNPCGGKGADPCHLTVNLLDAMQNKTLLTYRAGHPDEAFRSGWRSLLSWDHSVWMGYTSHNKPVLAHALALWRSSNPDYRNEWDNPNDRFTNPNPVTWWRDYLQCQNGGACAKDAASSIRYLKAAETLSNTYDADTTRAVVAVYHWTIKETIEGRRTPEVAHLADQAMVYMRYTWALYALGAGPGPAEYMKHRGNRLDPLVAQRCQFNSNGYWYDGPFLALAGERSGWGHLCQEDRGQMFTRALLPEWNTMARNLPANAPVNYARETNAQNNLLDEIQAQQESWKTLHPTTYPGATLNAYGLDTGQRQLIVNHILTGNSGAFFHSFLNPVRLRVTYHFLGWVDANDQQVRLTVMESNVNRNTIPTYAVLYRHGTRTAEALMPWVSVPVKTFAEGCYRNRECEAMQDSSKACYYEAHEERRCWTRPERDDVTLGQAFLSDGTNRRDDINPVKVRGTNIGPGEEPTPSGEFDVHGTITEQITGLNIPPASSGRRRYHIIFSKDAPPRSVW